MIVICDGVNVSIPTVKNGGISEYNNIHGSRLPQLDKTKYCRAETLDGEVFELGEEFEPNKLVKTITGEGRYVSIRYEMDMRKFETIEEELFLVVPSHYITRRYEDTITFKEGIIKVGDAGFVRSLSLGENKTYMKDTTAIVHSISYNADKSATVHVSVYVTTETADSEGILHETLKLKREQFASLAKVINNYNSIVLDGKRYMLGDMMGRKTIHAIYIYQRMVYIELLSQSGLISTKQYKV